VNSKALIMTGLVVGSTIGGYVPTLWGADFLSVSSVVMGMIGGFAGIWAGYRLSRM